MKLNLTKFLIKNIIAPHGVTDLTHSIQTNNVENLLRLEVLNLGFCELMTNVFHFNNFYDIVFFLFTSIHFRYDFPNITYNNIKLPKYFSSASYIFICLFLDKILPFHLGFDFLLYYMSFIHVPNHYKNNWFHIDKEFTLNLLVLSFTIVLINAIYQYYPSNILNDDFVNIFKSIIIAHVLYQEIYIFEKKKIE